MANAMPGSQKSVVLLGGGSTLARAMAMRFAEKGFALVLADLDTAELEVIAQDLRVRYGQSCRALHFDALDYGSHGDFAAEC